MSTLPAATARPVLAHRTPLTWTDAVAIVPKTAVVVSLFARVRKPLPLTPILLAGVTLGLTCSMLSQSAYLAFGLFGLPLHRWCGRGHGHGYGVRSVGRLHARVGVSGRNGRRSRRRGIDRSAAGKAALDGAAPPLAWRLISGPGF